MFCIEAALFSFSGFKKGDARYDQRQIFHSEWNTSSFHGTGDGPEQTHSHPLVKMDPLLTCTATQKLFPVLRWVTLHHSEIS